MKIRLRCGRRVFVMHNKGGFVRLEGVMWRWREWWRVWAVVFMLEIGLTNKKIRRHE